MGKGFCDYLPGVTDVVNPRLIRELAGQLGDALRFCRHALERCGHRRCRHLLDQLRLAVEEILELGPRLVLVEKAAALDLGRRHATKLVVDGGYCLAAGSAFDG